MTRFGEYYNFDLTYFIFTPIDPGLSLDFNSNLYNMDFFVYSGSNKTAVYDFWRESSSIGLNFFGSSWFLLSFGLRKGFFFIKADIVEDPKRDKYKFDVIAFTSKLKIDTMNRRYYPDRGILLKSEIDYVKSYLSFYSSEKLKDDFKRGFACINLACPLWWKFAVHGGGVVSSVTTNQSPPSYWIALGGSQKYENWIFPLNGYGMMEKTAPNGWAYNIDLQCEVFSNFFIIARWNEGRVVYDYDQLFKYTDTSAAYGLITGYITPFGPLEISLFRKKDTRDYTLHFSLGFIF